MSIRFTDDYNKIIRREVSNFNRRRKTAIRAGFKNLPDKAYVSELKRRYDKRENLNRELSLLNDFRRDSLREVELAGGVKSVAWNVEHIKNNLEQAKKFYDKEAEILSSRVGRFPSEQDRLNTILANRRALDYELNNINQEQFEDIEGSIKSFIRSRNKWAAGYRGFMSEIDEVMARTNIPEEKRKEFFDKFKKLNHEEFYYVYESSDTIKRIYALIDSPKNKNEMNASTKDARGYVDTLMDEIDLLIDEAKNR